MPGFLGGEMPLCLGGTIVEALLMDERSIKLAFLAPKKLLIMSKIETIVQCLHKHMPQKILMPIAQVVPLKCRLQCHKTHFASSIVSS